MKTLAKRLNPSTAVWAIIFTSLALWAALYIIAFQLDRMMEGLLQIAWPL